MGNFFRNGVIKLANTAILFGVLLAGYSAYEAFKERSVSSTATEISIAEIGNHPDLMYASISGGQLDVVNTMISELQGKRGATYSTNYYIPVLNEGGEVSYILQTADDPSALGTANANFTGLLQNADGLASELKEKYNEQYSDQQYLHLDTTHKPESAGKKFGMIGAFLGIAIAAFFLRRFLIGGARAR